jgi:hypothetical protein
MEALLQGAVGQYIDDNGKTRMISYGSETKGISLMISPIPPLDIPIDTKIRTTTLERAMRFIREKKFSVTAQDGNDPDSGGDGEIQGLWVSPFLLDSPSKGEGLESIYYGYIPVTLTKGLEDITYRTEDPPLKANLVQGSDVEIYRRTRKIAIVLKAYVLYTYAKNPDAFGGDPESETFGDDAIVVVKDHVYDIALLNKKLYGLGDGRDNRVIFRSGKLIASSKKMKSKLLAYLKVCLLNDSTAVAMMANTQTIDEYYESISDFRPAENQLIFDSVDNIVAWRKDALEVKSVGDVHINLLSPDRVEPYYYRNFLFDTITPAIVQNVKGGDKKIAITIAYRWLDDKVNMGYDVPVAKNIKDISYVEYDPETGKTEEHIHKTVERAKIIRLGEEKYAALFFF